MRIGILGGTGPAGRGLAVRAALAGHDVTLGSRDAQRAQETAQMILDANQGATLSIKGGDNEAATNADLIVLATPWEGAVSTIKALSGQLEGKSVVSMVNALMKEGREMLPLYPPRGSMAGQVAAALPSSEVVAAFAQASPIEAFTAVCITLNIRHKAHSTLRLAGI